MNRAVDLALAVPALCATAPVLGALALLVRLDSPGPALFVQRRVGQGGKPIRVLKLRTMQNGARGAAVTARGDPRVTRVGRVLRATKLDELPQLWNVVRGDLSLVGPRPEVERYVARYRPEWRHVLSVRPGLTDAASLAFRDEEALLGGARDPERAYVEVLLPAKMALALDGVRRATLGRDLATLAATAAALLGFGRAHPALAHVRRAIAELERASP